MDKQLLSFKMVTKSRKVQNCMNLMYINKCFATLVKKDKEWKTVSYCLNHLKNGL